MISSSISHIPPARGAGQSSHPDITTNQGRIPVNHFIRHWIPADEDCLFYAIHMGLDQSGVQTSAQEARALRLQVAGYVDNNFDALASKLYFGEGQRVSNLQNLLLNPRQWNEDTGNLVASLLAQILRREVIILQTQENVAAYTVRQVFTPNNQLPQGISNTGQAPIYLVDVADGTHYEYLEPCKLLANINTQHQAEQASQLRAEERELIQYQLQEDDNTPLPININTQQREQLKQADQLIAEEYEFILYQLQEDDTSSSSHINTQHQPAQSTQPRPQLQVNNTVPPPINENRYEHASTVDGMRLFQRLNQSESSSKKRPAEHAHDNVGQAVAKRQQKLNSYSQFQLQRKRVLNDFMKQINQKLQKVEEQEEANKSGSFFITNSSIPLIIKQKRLDDILLDIVQRRGVSRLSYLRENWAKFSQLDIPFDKVPSIVSKKEGMKTLDYLQENWTKLKRLGIPTHSLLLIANNDGASNALDYLEKNWTKLTHQRGISVDSLVNIANKQGGYTNLDYLNKNWMEINQLARKLDVPMDKLLNILSNNGGSKNLDYLKKNWTALKQFIPKDKLLDIMVNRGSNRTLDCLRENREALIQLGITMDDLLDIENNVGASKTFDCLRENWGTLSNFTNNFGETITVDQLLTISKRQSGSIALESLLNNANIRALSMQEIVYTLSNAMRSTQFYKQTQPK